jgi:hypothetical protein
MNINLPENCQSGCTEIVVRRGNGVLIVAATVASIIATTPMARANAELEILVGSTVVYNSGTLVGTSAVNDSYSYSSGATSLSALYEWNDTIPAQSGLALGIDVNSRVPVTFELSDNDNPNTGGVYLYLVGQGAVFGSVSSFYSADNVLLSKSTPLSTIPVLTGAPYGLTPHALGVSSPYSLTEVLTVTGTVTGVDNLTVEMNLVPDGGMTLLMILLGFCALLSVGKMGTIGKARIGLALKRNQEIILIHGRQRERLDPGSMIYASAAQSFNLFQ